MGKIAPVSTKYIICADVKSTGVVKKPDVIGAIFGQTEGLLGTELELRELQKSGRIGRIDVNLEDKSGRSSGEIIIPSSLDRAETAIIAAAIETIQRVGPCDSEIKVIKIEDVRVSKRKYVLNRAKELLNNMIMAVDTSSQELADEVFESVRVMEIKEYGRDKLPAGPGIEDSEEIILVEGRADVINLLRSGFRNVVAMNGTSVPETIVDLSKVKDITVFIDGDRGGELIVSSLRQLAEIDFIAVAPAGKEVEELTKKEIHKALRAKQPMDQFHFSDVVEENNRRFPKPQNGDRRLPPRAHPIPQKPRLSVEEQKTFKGFLEELVGTNGAYILDEDLQVLGKVPLSELKNSLKELEDAFVVILDGEVDSSLLNVARDGNVHFIVGLSTQVSGTPKTVVVTSTDLGL